MRSWLRFVLFSIAASVNKAEKYYENAIYMQFTWSMTDSYCNFGGRHSASIHSSDENKAVHHECLSTSQYYINANISVPNCWIGLYIDTNQSYQWTDHTAVNINTFETLWCRGYPYINNNITHQISAVYIDSSIGCWYNTYDLKKQMQLICGPAMFMDRSWWIQFFYLPLGLLTIVLIYNMYICSKLKYYLYTMRLNWIIRPSQSVKCTAMTLTALFGLTCLLLIVCQILQIIAYHQTGIIPPANLADKHYPKIYNISAIFIYLVGFLYIVASLIGYIHILVRLKNEFDNNEYMGAAIPSYCGTKQWFYICMLILIGTIPIIIIWIFIAHYGQRRIALCVYVVAVVLINVLLLYMYLRGLHQYAHYKNKDFGQDIQRRNVNCNVLDDRTDELMIEATRHTVVFALFMIYNVFILFMIIALFMIDNAANWNGRTVGIIATIILMIRELLFIQSLYLSFKFSHRMYEKCYCCCDKWMKHCCYHITKNRYQRYLIASDNNQKAVRLCFDNNQNDSDQFD